MFFAEIGFVFPPFPFVAHTLGWNFEDMERNTEYVHQSEELRRGTRQLIDRSMSMASDLIARNACPPHIERGGRKAHSFTEESGAAEATG
jgi:hypothetical protein